MLCPASAAEQKNLSWAYRQVLHSAGNLSADSFTMYARLLFATWLLNACSVLRQLTHCGCMHLLAECIPENKGTYLPAQMHFVEQHSIWQQCSTACLTRLLCAFSSKQQHLSESSCIDASLSIDFLYLLVRVLLMRRAGSNFNRKQLCIACLSLCCKDFHPEFYFKFHLEFQLGFQQSGPPNRAAMAACFIKNAAKYNLLLQI